jgi:S-DNA-T family DNA segregation ATPase FtsK/SpoIIIE
MLPSSAILDAPSAEAGISERELMESARLLEEAFHGFGVAGSVVRIQPGPVVSTFEFALAAGVPASRAASLADDLALAMSVESVRIERVRGHASVGVQLPNARRASISLRELLESQEYRRSRSDLALALGRTAQGDPFVGRLASMPHLLLAGSRGPGKAVALGAMIASLLFRATPDVVRLILIAPNPMDLGLYDGIPHLLAPVIVDPKRASNALAWAVREAERRQKVLVAGGVREIERYNRSTGIAVASKAARRRRPPPHIVVVIDEFGELMIGARREVEASIAGLAGLGRAVGIHLILATGRPSDEVMTDVIGRSAPARAALRVSSKRESRAILGRRGAEQLLGGGDMLFRQSPSSRLRRLHGPLITEMEVARLAAFLRRQGRPVHEQALIGDLRRQ